MLDPDSPLWGYDLLAIYCVPLCSCPFGATSKAAEGASEDPLGPKGPKKSEDLILSALWAYIARRAESLI